MRLCWTTPNNVNVCGLVKIFALSSLDAPSPESNSLMQASINASNY